MLGLVFAALYVGAFGAWFVELEHRGDRHRIAMVALVVLVIEGVLAGGAASVPVGALRPAIFGQDFRPEDAVIVAAVIARLLGGAGSRRRLAGWWVLWAAFLAWFAAGAGVGVLGGAPVVPVLFEAKLVFYVAGSILIGSGVDRTRLAAGLGRAAPLLAAVAVVSLVLRVGRISFSFDTPVQRFRSLGVLSNDCITLLACAGVLILLLQASGLSRSLFRIACGLVLLAAPLGGQQRASYAVVAVLVVVVGLLSLGRTWSRWMVMTHTEMALIAGVVVLFGALTVVAPGATSPILLRVDKAFAGEAEAGSADARLLLAREAVAAISEHPFIGSGLGAKVTITAPVSGREVNAAAHNIVLDLWLRGGVVSVGLFALALAATALAALRLWRSSRPIDAVMAMGALLAVVAVVSKSLLEPALFKFRLSCLLGLAVGLLLAAAADAPQRTAHGRSANAQLEERQLSRRS